MPPTDHQRSKVLRPADAVDGALSADRRRFVKRVGMAVLTVHCLPLSGCSADQSSAEIADVVESLKVLSTPGKFGHVHDLVIPLALLSTPPAQGVALTTSKAFLHQHHVTLTQDELTRVHGGGTVTQKASSHRFVIALAKGQDPLAGPS